MRLFLIVSALAISASCQIGSESIESETVTYTWHSDVKPLVDNYCIRCHTEGSIGVGDFRDQDTVFALADLMLARIQEGSMPLPSPTRPAKITWHPSISPYRQAIRPSLLPG